MDSRTAFRDEGTRAPWARFIFSQSRYLKGTFLRIAAQALFTAAASALTKATPPTSDLWMMSGETILRTTDSASRPLKSLRVTAFSAGTKTWRGGGGAASFHTPQNSGCSER